MGRLLFALKTVLLFSFALLLGCSDSRVELTPEESAWLKAHGDSIVLEYDASFQPVEFERDGLYSGIAADVIREVESILSVDIIERPTKDWNQSVERLKTGETQLLGAMVKNPEREKIALFTDSYFTLSGAFFAKKGTPYFTDLSALVGKKVAVVDGYAQQAYLVTHTDTSKVHLVPVKTMEEGLMRLMFGEVDYFAGSIASVSWKILTIGATNLTISGEIPSPLALSIAVSKQHPLLFSAMDKAVRVISVSKRDEIKQRWIVYGGKRQVSPVLIWSIITLLVIAVVILLIRQYRIRRESELTAIRFGKQLAEISAEMSDTMVYQLKIHPSGKREVIFVSDGVKKLHGVTAEEVAADPTMLYRQIDPSDIDRLMDCENRALAAMDMFRCEVRFNHPDGSTRWSLLTSSPRKLGDGSVIWDGVDLDITRFKTLEHELEESRRFTVQAVDSSHELFGWLSLDGTLLFANATSLKMIGSSLDDVVGQKFWDTPWFNHDAIEQDKVKEAIETASTGVTVQYEAYHKSESGLLRTVEFTLTPTKDLHGTITMLTAEGIDTTEKIHAEKALKSLSTSYAHLSGKAFYEAITAHIAEQMKIDFIFVGKLNRAERSVTVLGGYALGERMGDLTYDLADTPCSNVMDQGTCVFPNAICELYPKDILLQQMAIEGYVGSMVKGKDGLPIGILVALNQSVIVQTEELTNMFNIFLDRVSAEMQRGISEEVLALEMKEKERLTEQLHQSQKMEAVGQLAGGVAHDFNNALGGIMGAVELLKAGGLSESEQTEYLDMILTAGERAADLTKKLLLFSRKGNKVSSAVNCALIIEETAALLKHTINKNIQVRVENRAIQTSVVGDDSLLQNAFMNMGINASHAMPNGGELVFVLENLELDAEYCEVSPFEIKPGEYLEISIRDTGTGMSPEIQSRIFEPFFTTKEAGKGTGLGMAAVYGTVQEHGGAITVYSEEGTGTVFRMYLPITTETVRREITDEPVVVGSGTILVIDDEELIRLTASAMLRTMGYRVILATNGEEGVETFRDAHDEIDLIILDMIMPVMGGRDAFVKLRELDPTIPVIIASGFAKEEDMSELKRQGVNGFLNKPFRKAELAEMVKKFIQNPKLDA